jgi:ribokinase
MRNEGTAPHIVVVGSTMIDLSTYVDLLPERGETVVGERFMLGYGGKGANQAVMAARLGAGVTFVNCVGDDLFGEMVRKNLGDRGIDVSRVRTVKSESTGVAAIWVERDGMNRIVITPGANYALSAADVAAELADVAPAHCVICQLEIGHEAVAAALRWGRACQAVTILNPAPAAALDAELLGLVDWLVPNETEFELLFGAPADAASLLRFDASLSGGLVVTLGDRGAATVVAGKTVTCPAPEVETIDTTGAGDAFVGGLAYALARGETIVSAVTFANWCGARSTTRYGTQTSFPDAATAVQEAGPLGR